MAALDSVDMTHTEAEALAAQQRGQPSESPELGAAAARPLHDYSRRVHRNGPLNTTAQPTKRKHTRMTGETTATQAVACVFGDDNGRGSSSSSADSKDNDITPVLRSPEHLEQPANLPGKGNVLSRPKDAMVQKVQAVKRHSTRGAKSSDEATLHEATALPGAKRQAGEAEQGAEHAGSARPKKPAVAASKVSKHSKVGQSAHRSKVSPGKAVTMTAGMHCQRETKPSEEAAHKQVKAAAVDWKAYADDLVVRMAEAEVLLADDSG